MAAKLTARQELFAQGLMRGMSQREAYKLAGYKVPEKAKDKAGASAIDANASRLIRNDKVGLRLADMEAAKRISDSVTVQSVSLMLADVYDDARRFKQIGAAATAAMGIAKLHGLLVDRVEDITRRPARSPDAPLEIEIDSWLTEHTKALTVSANDAAQEPSNSDDDMFA